MNSAATKLNNGYIEKLHSNSKGWITKAEINSGYNQWHYKYLELMNQNLCKKNTYISLNTFYSTYRRHEYIKELKAHYIDLDTYKTNFTKDQILMRLRNEYFNKSIPRPNIIMDSGRGLYLIWLINPVPSGAFPLWKAVEEYLYNQLKDFGADRQALDATRILRVPGSINSKSNSVVSILDEYNYVYDLREIQHEFLPELKPKQKKRGRPKKIRYIYTKITLYYFRTQDLTKLCELREYKLKGYRELILFLYRYWSCYYKSDVEMALKDTLKLNSQFRLPLSENEAIRATKSAETAFYSKDKQYKYKNETLINLLDISEAEQTYMSTIISKKEYKKRKNIRDKIYQKNRYMQKLKAKGRLTKKEQLEQIRDKIKSLKEKGLRNKDICFKLDLAESTLKRHITYLKKNGLIK